MSSELATLTILPVNKTVVFYSPIEGKDVLVRTGTIAEGSCFLAGTRVYTQDGVKNIEEVEINDEVITHEGNIKKVLQLHKNPLGDRRVHDLDVYKTPTIHVTNNHRFMAIQKTGKQQFSEPKWIKTEDLDKSCYIMVPKKNGSSMSTKLDLMDYLSTRTRSATCEYKYTEIDDKIRCETSSADCSGGVGDKNSRFINRYWNIDNDFCEFLGMWYGDGCVLTRKRLHDTIQKGISICSCRENKSLIDFVVKTGRDLFGIDPTIYESKNQNLVTITFNSTIVGYIFEKVFGKGFAGKTLPSFIYNLNGQLIKSFISGLISTDGCVDTGLNVSVTMTNPKLIEEIYHLCRSVGLGVSASYRNSQSGKLTGYIRFLKDGLNLEKIKKVYTDERMKHLIAYEHSGYVNNYANIDGILYMRVIDNNISTDKPEYVYTLGIEDDHSYAVEGLIVENCFFHALLHAYSKDYVSMNAGGRMKFVKRLRSSIARKIDKGRWESLSNGLIAKIPFQENVNTILSDFYRYIARGGSGRTKSVRKIIREVIKDPKGDTEAYKLVSEMVPLEKGFEKNILPSSYEKCNEEGITACKKTVVDYATRYYKKEFSKLEGQLKEERIQYYINKLKLFVTAVVDEAENSAYNEYIESLHDASMEVDSYTIGLISEKFNRDIYFIDARTRMPYRDASHENIRKRKSIIVMWTGGCHYEIVGRLLAGNRIQREFEFKDSIIQRIHTYLCRPEKIPDKYPNLIPYLPKDLRKKLKIDVSDSEEDRRSDRSYRSDDDGKYVSSDEDFENSSAYERSDSEYDEPQRESQKHRQKESKRPVPKSPTLNSPMSDNSEPSITVPKEKESKTMDRKHEVELSDAELSHEDSSVPIDDGSDIGGSLLSR